MDADEPIDIFADFSTPPPTIEFVLPNLGTGSIGALVSPGGVGKSMLVWQLATQIAGGPDLLGIGKLISGQVVYLPAEDSRIAIRNRVHSLGAHLTLDERKIVAANVLIHPLNRSCRDIMKREGYERLLQFARGRRLMIFDTLRRFHVEEENASGAMSLVLDRMESIADETNCAIIFLHHASKEVALMGGSDQQQASRGSSVLTDNVRWQEYLVGMTSKEAKEWNIEDDQRNRFVRFGVSKVNYGQRFDEIWMQRHEGGILKSADPSKKPIWRGRERERA